MADDTAVKKILAKKGIEMLKPPTGTNPVAPFRQRLRMRISSNLGQSNGQKRSSMSKL